MFRKTAGFRDSVRRFARARVAERSPQSSGQPLQIFQGARNVRQRALQPPDMIFTELGLPSQGQASFGAFPRNSYRRSIML